MTAYQEERKRQMAVALSIIRGSVCGEPWKLIAKERNAIRAYLALKIHASVEHPDV